MNHERWKLFLQAVRTHPLVHAKNKRRVQGQDHKSDPCGECECPCGDRCDFVLEEWDPAYEDKPGPAMIRFLVTKRHVHIECDCGYEGIE